MAGMAIISCTIGYSALKVIRAQICSALKGKKQMMNDDKKVATRKMSQSEVELLKEIRKQTQAPYSDIVEGIRIYKLDKKEIVNYLREIAVVYA